MHGILGPQSQFAKIREYLSPILKMLITAQFELFKHQIYFNLHQYKQWKPS